MARDDIRKLFREKRGSANVTGKAPCGHPGEHIVGSYVRCLHGCEGAVPAHVRPEVTEKICRHDSKYVAWSSRYQSQVIQCADCDRVLQVV